MTKHKGICQECAQEIEGATYIIVEEMTKWTQIITVCEKCQRKTYGAS